jgi:hypothetical protein
MTTLITSMYDMHCALILWHKQLTFDDDDRVVTHSVQQILSMAMYENVFRRVYTTFVTQLVKIVGM